MCSAELVSAVQSLCMCSTALVCVCAVQSLCVCGTVLVCVQYRACVCVCVQYSACVCAESERESFRKRDEKYKCLPVRKVLL